MELHFIFLWFAQIFGQFLSLKALLSPPKFSAVMLISDGVYIYLIMDVHIFVPLLFFVFAILG